MLSTGPDTGRLPLRWGRFGLATRPHWTAQKPAQTDRPIDHRLGYDYNGKLPQTRCDGGYCSLRRSRAQHASTPAETAAQHTKKQK